jgi:hypothetical protein
MLTVFADSDFGSGREVPESDPRGGRSFLVAYHLLLRQCCCCAVPRLAFLKADRRRHSARDRRTAAESNAFGACARQNIRDTIAGCDPAGGAASRCSRAAGRRRPEGRRKAMRSTPPAARDGRRDRTRVCVAEDPRAAIRGSRAAPRARCRTAEAKPERKARWAAVARVRGRSQPAKTRCGHRVHRPGASAAEHTQNRRLTQQREQNSRWGRYNGN